MKEDQRDFARAMRTAPTEAEAKLWGLLRDRRLSHLKFRRQVPIGRYIADFVCFERRLIIEADGSQHAENGRDKTRDAWFEAEGFTVVRFWNSEIMSSPRVVQDTILARAGMPW